MLRLPLLLVAGIAALAASTVPASGDAAAVSTPEAKATHTITIDYQQRRGDMRRAMLKLAPKDEGARPLWRGGLSHISILTTNGNWIIIESFLSSGHTTGHHAEARAMLPAAENISAIIAHPERGTPIGWKVEEGESYTEVEWTYFSQQGSKIPPPAPLEASGDDDDDCGPVPAGCEVYNPWTCECDISLKDPFEKTMEGESFIMSI